MKNLFIVSFMVLGLGLSPVCLAQDNGGRPAKEGRGDNAKMEERQKQQLEKMKKELSLTDEQFAKVEALQKEQADKMKARMENMKSGGEKKDRDAMRKEMEEERSAQNAKMKKILTDEQYKKYEKMAKERGPRGGDRPDMGPGNAPDGEMLEPQ